jgi:hypothetical protein
MVGRKEGTRVEEIMRTSLYLPDFCDRILTSMMCVLTVCIMYLASPTADNNVRKKQFNDWRTG